MEIKKKHNIGFILFISLFLVFISTYFLAATDIYKYKEYNKMSITKESMKKFEKDIEEGKDISINDYLEIKKDYSNGMSNLGYKASNIVENFMSKGIKRTFKILASLFT